MQQVRLNGDLTYNACVQNSKKSRILRGLSPKLIPGLHHAFNGPVDKAIAIHGNLTILDFVKLRVFCLFGIANDKLEMKLRAIGNAFREEAALLEADRVEFSETQEPELLTL